MRQPAERASTAENTNVTESEAENTRTGESSTTKLRPFVPPSLSDKEKRLEIKEAKGSKISWPQGELDGKPVWHTIIVSPDNQRSISLFWVIDRKALNTSPDRARLTRASPCYSVKDQATLLNLKVAPLTQRSVQSAVAGK